ncbi:MAG: FAD-binding protein, partial [Eubacteriales bacterium]
SGDTKLTSRPVVIGSGPAGLFCAYELALHGYEPILLERGYQVEKRQHHVEDFWATGVLNPKSNVQFGEGGAGTFSDGKLNTLVKDKFARSSEVLNRFVEFGAPSDILWDSKPHIGTDLLIFVIKTMRQNIIDLGGSVRFESQVTDFKIIKENGRNTLVGIYINDQEFLETQAVVLAVGHSARDTFSVLAHRQVPMLAKSFAVGFRIEHKQSMINESQYGIEQGEYLPPASYKLTAQTTQGRGVYSFCMCPGGYVVNASSQEGRLAVNGMSYHKRDSQNANSAVVISVSQDDYEGSDPLAGMHFQEQLEERTYELAKGKIPVQTWGDFKRNISTESSAIHHKTCMKGAYEGSNLRSLLSDSCNHALMEGMEQFGRKIKGFDEEDALLSAIESRTSSPVRISRDESFQSQVLGLYPCGEGAGYAGGITSAAIDGIKVAEQIAKTYAPFRNSYCNLSVD